MPDQQHTPPLWVDRAIAVTEDVVYGVLPIVLVGGAAILIGDAVVHLVDEAGRNVDQQNHPRMVDRLPRGDLYLQTAQRPCHRRYRRQASQCR